MKLSTDFSDPRLVKTFNQQDFIFGYHPSTHGSVLVIVAAGQGWAIRWPTLRLDLLLPPMIAIGKDQNNPIELNSIYRIYQEVCGAVERAARSSNLAGHVIEASAQRKDHRDG